MTEKDISNSPLIGGPTERPTTSITHYPFRIAAHTLDICLDTCESTIKASFYMVKNIELGQEGEIKFMHLVHNKRIGNTTTPSDSDYPVQEDNENFIEYLLRIEKLPWMEWQMVFFNTHDICNIRGRTVYTTDDKGNYTFISGNRLSTKEPDGPEDQPNNTVVQMKRG